MNEPYPPHGPGQSPLHGNPQRQAPHPPPMRPPGIAQPGMRPPATAPGTRSPTLAPSTHIPTELELEPISLVEDATEAHLAAAPSAPKKILAFGADMAARRHDWKRQATISGTGAVRVKSFHGKYSEQGLDYLDNAINEWLDNNPDVEVKFVTPTVMTFEGKIREPALVLNLWY